MSRLLTFSLTLVCLAAGTSRAADDAQTPETVVVETTSGRVFTGRLDPGTTRATLALRTGRPDMYLVRKISWQRVAQVRIDGQPTSTRALVSRFDKQGWPAVAEELPGPDHSAPVVPAAQTKPAPPQALVRQLVIEATVGKWRSGVENDGVVVRVYPLDADGNIVPVQGTLEVDVIGQRAPNRRNTPVFPRLVHWTTQVKPQDFSETGATYRVPFRALHPEFDLQLRATGAVHARLSVPGHGVFDATLSTVWLRPLSTTRDHLQQQSGQRFFPEERTNRGTNDSGDRY